VIQSRGFAQSVEYLFLCLICINNNSERFMDILGTLASSGFVILYKLPTADAS
jgi:hypothetical protein